MTTAHTSEAKKTFNRYLKPRIVDIVFKLQAIEYSISDLLGSQSKSRAATAAFYVDWTIRLQSLSFKKNAIQNMKEQEFICIFMDRQEGLGQLFGNGDRPSEREILRRFCIKRDF